jgi:hypothetical protein
VIITPRRAREAKERIEEKRKWAQDREIEYGVAY